MSGSAEAVEGPTDTVEASSSRIILVREVPQVRSIIIEVTPELRV